MIIQDYKCRCPRCRAEQCYYRMLSGGKYELPKCLENKCKQCGHQLEMKDVTNWDEVEEMIKGEKGRGDIH